MYHNTINLIIAHISLHCLLALIDVIPNLEGIYMTSNKEYRLLGKYVLTLIPQKGLTFDMQHGFGHKFTKIFFFYWKAFRDRAKN